MSAEFWEILGLGITILIATGAQHRDLRRRIDAIEHRLDRIETHVEEIERRLSRLEGRFDEMSRWTKDLLEALVRRPAA